MASWSDLEREAPTIAAEGRRLLEARGHGEAFLATVRGDAAPRIHPISMAIVDGEVLAFIIENSPKYRDLEQDGRYAMHSHQEADAPDELALRGRARLVTDVARRAAAMAIWFFEPDDTYGLFAFDVESAVLGQRGADEWPPRYTRWTSAR
jgi:uncharacterized pyridoxamine 5'-phosphate oxidase family protein